MRISLGDASLWFDVSGPWWSRSGSHDGQVRPGAAGGGFPGAVLRPAGPRPQRSQQRRVLERADLRRLCDALGLRQPVVLGSSFGGNVVLTYVGLFPRSPRRRHPGQHQRGPHGPAAGHRGVRPPRRCSTPGCHQLGV